MDIQHLPRVTRGDIIALEQAMIEQCRIQDPGYISGNTDDLCPHKDHFAPGLYAREIFIPAGTRIIGKIHRHSHLNTISQGQVIVFTEFGNDLLTAPVTFVSKPGTKRVVFAVKDTIWTTYHPTDKKDVSEIEREIIAPSFEALEAPKETS
jgi:hypothetical protein